MKKIVGIYLAAGQSGRMGTDKLNLSTTRGPLGSLALRTVIQSGLTHTFIVTGNNHLPAWLTGYFFGNKRRGKWSHICCQNADEGQANSIREGILAAKLYDADAAVIILADQPLIPRSAIDALLLHFRSDPSCIVVTTNGEIISPPVLFPKAWFEPLLQLRGDQGAKQLIQQESRIQRIPSSLDTTLFDVDNEQDYRKLVQLLDSRA